MRVGVKNAGCAGMAYTLDPVETPNPTDDVVSEKGVTVFVEAKATMFLLDPAGNALEFKAMRNPDHLFARQ